MPRCPAHCPPPTSGAPLAAAIIACVFAIAATWTVIVHILTILVIILGVVAGLSVAGLAAIILTRLRDTARQPSAPSGTLQARAGVPRPIRAVGVDRRQMTTSQAPTVGYQQGRETGHGLAPAIEQHWHLHLHAAGEVQLGHLLGQTPERMPGGRNWSPAPNEGGGHHDA